LTIFDNIIRLSPPVELYGLRREDELAEAG
jgi:hypothetical protein